MQFDPKNQRGPAESGVWAIVVTYQPDIATLRAALMACAEQVARVLVVDNGSELSILALLRELAHQTGCSLNELGSNLGIAAAQNRGIAQARARGATHVLLLDQDSVPSSGMVERLRSALTTLADDGISVAAVGPRLVDRRTGTSTPFIRICILGVTKKTCQDDSQSLIETDFLVSSGMLVPLEVFDRVGLPEEGLFIDNVDLEWCFRARAMKLILYGVCDAVMEHSIGDTVIRFGGSTIHRHDPLRQYYIMRNRILLYQRSYSPWGWVVQDFFRMLFKLVLFSLVFTPRGKNIHMMFKGIKDGLHGKVGKLH